MSSHFAQSMQRGLAEEDQLVWLYVLDTRGSAPRDAGTSMWVSARRLHGTIGGGHLEQVAIEVARDMMVRKQHTASLRSFPLGPSLGQCCGGRVDLLFLPLQAADSDWLDEMAMADRAGQAFQRKWTTDTGDVYDLTWTSKPWPIYVFGAGHVGQALVDVLTTLPCAVTWVDSRQEYLSMASKDNLTCLETDDPASEVRQIPAAADVLVLTHSHALDFEVCVQLLQRHNLGFIGLIGSKTKRASFEKRLLARGFTAAQVARIHCPIGLAQLNQGVDRKHPGVIAVSVAAQLLALRQSQEMRGWECKSIGEHDERDSAIAA